VFGQEQKELQTVIEDICSKAKLIKDISFDKERVLISEKGKYEEEKSHVVIKFPDKMYSDTSSKYMESSVRVPGYESRRTEIRNGNDEWSFNFPKSVSKFTDKRNHHGWVSSPVPTCRCNPVTYFYVSDVNGGKVSKISYLGQESIEGEPCYELSTGTDSVWISKSDGIVRKLSRPPQKPALGHQIFFRSIQINKGVTDQFFDYKPDAGANVSETIFLADGTEQRKDWDVPYPVNNMTPEQKTLTENKKKEIIAAFANVQDFTSQYHHIWHSEAQTEYPPKSGKLVKTGNDTRGLLKFKKPMLMNLKYSYTFLPEGLGQKPQEKLFIINSQTIWTGSPMGLDGQKMYITEENRAAKLAFQEKLKKTAEKLKQEAAKFNEKRQQVGDLVQPPDDLFGMELIGIPAYVFTPFAGIPGEDIVFEKEESLDGVKTYLFSTQENTKHRKIKLWTGVADGVLRRAEEYDWRGENPEIEVTLKEVSINQKLSDSDFNLPADQKAKVVKMDSIRSSYEDILAKSLDVPPEETFKTFFDSPVNEVTSLKGTGMAMIGYQMYITFTAEKEPVLKEAAKFISLSAKEDDFNNSIDFFKKAFPESGASLKNPDDLEMLILKKQFESRCLIKNKKEHRYFFSVSGNAG
jgi:outer membrane lipoprotein-sorting protein